MLRVQAGDTDAFSCLFDRHNARALAVAGAVCRDRGRTEDAVQEGFLTVWRLRQAYTPGRGSFRAWAMTIVRHRAVDSVRAETSGTRPAQVTSERPVAAVAPGSLQDDAIERSEAAALRDSLRALPDEQAEVIVLAFFGQLTHSEIAAQLGLPPGTVKGRMRLGFDKLRDAAADSRGQG